MRILCSVSQKLGALQTNTTDTILFFSHTTNVLLFKFRCNIFIARFGSEWDILYIFEKAVVRTQEIYMIYSHLGINSYLKIRRYYKTQISLSLADFIQGEAIPVQA